MATGAATLFAATPANAQAPADFYGVVPQDQPTKQDLVRMGDGQVGTVRVTLAWSEIDRSPVPQEYEWTEFDGIVAEAARQDIRVLPTIFTVPPWVSAMEGCDKPPGGLCEIRAPQSADGLEAWRTFTEAAAARYGPGGLFWTINPTLPERPIRTWQIWNEQNSPGFYQPRPDVGDYAALLKAASDGIRAEDPGAEIVLGGLYRYPLRGAQGGIRATDYLERLYDHEGIAEAFDGVAIHPYAARLRGVKAQIQRVIRVVDAHGDGQEGIWITELGWASDGRRNPLNRGPKGQAARLRSAFTWLTGQREALALRLVAWFAWRDTPPGEGRCQWCAHSGLFESGTLTPKPAWNEFVRFSGGR